MYLMFKYDPLTDTYHITSDFCDPTRPTDKDNAQKRSAAIKNFIMRAKLEHGLKDDGFASDCYAAIQGVDDPQIDFQLHLVLAHWKLEPEVRARREASITSIFSTYFGQPVDPLALTVPAPGGPVPLMRMLVTVPDELLDGIGRLFCKSAAVGLKSSKPADLSPGALELLPAVNQRRVLIEDMQASFNTLANSPEFILLSECAWSRQSLDYCGKLTAAVIALAEANEGRAFLKALADAFWTEQGGWSTPTIDAVARAVHERLMTGPAEDAELVIAWYREQCDTIEKSAYMAAVEATQDAAARGVDLGAFTVMCKTALKEFLINSPGVDTKKLLTRLRKTKLYLKDPEDWYTTRQRERFHDFRVVDSPWVRQCWRWAQDQLAQWCSGPIACENSQALDVEAIRKQLNLSKPGLWTSDDVRAVIRIGLDAAWFCTAQSLDDHYHIVSNILPDDEGQTPMPQHMRLFKAEVSKFEKYMVEVRGLLDRCNAEIKRFRNLIQPSTTFDVDAFRTAAEAQIRSLPPEYTITPSTSVHITEPMALNLAEWAAIAHAMNDHWLEGISSLKTSYEHGSKTQKLEFGEEAALALAVSAPFRRRRGYYGYYGYYMFVDAVLWRRRRHSSHPPTIGGLPGAPMDTAHWYSTELPCARLQIPLRGFEPARSE